MWILGHKGLNDKEDEKRKRCQLTKYHISIAKHLIPILNSQI